MFSGTVESPGETSNDKHTLQYPPGEMVICLIPGSSGQVVQTRHLAALILELLHDTRWQLTKTPYDRTAGSRVECTCTTPAGSIHDPDCPVAHYNRLHNPMCVCGDPNTTGVVHRQDGPCYQNRNHNPAKKLEWATVADEPLDAAQTRIAEALSGSRGEDQARLASIGLEWIDLMLRKNRDYGSSAWKVPVLAPELSAATAIRVRMSDKIERILSLLTKSPEIADESIRDTIQDLGVYCLLWLARPQEQP